MENAGICRCSLWPTILLTISWRTSEARVGRIGRAKSVICRRVKYRLSCCIQISSQSIGTKLLGWLVKGALITAALFTLLKSSMHCWHWCETIPLCFWTTFDFLTWLSVYLKGFTTVEADVESRMLFESPWRHKLCSQIHKGSWVGMWVSLIFHLFFQACLFCFQGLINTVDEWQAKSLPQFKDLAYPGMYVLICSRPRIVIVSDAPHGVLDSMTLDIQVLKLGWGTTVSSWRVQAFTL